jgi:PTH1 family peptidyl-tRNA hydrolase
LGNPGKQYSHTRHNVGFRTIDFISEIIGITLKKHLFEEFERAKGSHQGTSIVLVKPLTFMNHSGRVVRQILKGNNATVDDLLVICDHLDLPAGVVKMKLKGSSGGHKGLSSIIACTGTEEFKRLYIGIGRPVHRDDVIDFVLDRPSGNDKILIDTATEKAAQFSLMIVDHNPNEMMNIVNRR